MSTALATAIKNYDRAGYGAAVSPADREAARNRVLDALEESGVPTSEAIKVLHIVESASWSDGWTRGYDSGRSYYGPRRPA